MKLNNSFKVSIVARGISADNADTLSSAVSASRFSMAVQYAADKIASLSAKIKKLEDAESLSESQKLELAKARLDLSDLEAEKSKLEESYEGVKPALDTVVESLVAEGNTRSNVETMLRVIALDGNQFLAKYALGSDTFKDELMGKLTSIAESVRWSSAGTPVLGKDEREGYKSALKSLKGMIRQEFSLTADSMFLKRTMVNCSAEELGLLVQTFVRDFTVKRVKSDDGVWSVKYERQLRDWTSLRSQIVRIVLKRTMAAC